MICACVCVQLTAVAPSPPQMMSSYTSHKRQRTFSAEAPSAGAYVTATQRRVCESMGQGPPPRTAEAAAASSPGEAGGHASLALRATGSAGRPAAAASSVLPEAG